MLSKKNKSLILGSFITQLAINLGVLDLTNYNLHLACTMESLDLICLEKMDLVQQINGVFEFVPPGPIQLSQKRKASKSATSEAGGPSTDAPGPFSSALSPSSDLCFQLHHMDSKLERIEHQVSGMAQNLAQYFTNVGFRSPFPPES